MSLFQRAASWLTTETRSDGVLSTSGGSLRSYFETFGTNSGKVVVNEYTALSLPIVKRCIDLLSDSLAWPDCELIEEKDGMRSRAKDHPCWSILYDFPSELHSPYYAKKQILMYGFGWGNGYGHIIRNGIGRPVSIDVYPPWKVNILTDTNETKVWYQITGVEGYVNAEDMIHFKPFSLNGIKGVSPIQIAFNTVKLGLQGVRFPSSMLENGATMSGLVKHTARLSSEAKEKIRLGFQAKYHGMENVGTVGVLDEGMDYMPIGINPVDAQLLEILQLTNEQLCALYGVPQHMAGILTRSTNNNIEQQGIEFKAGLRPHAVHFEQELSRKLLFRRELKTYYYQIRLDELDLSDLTAKKEFIQTAVSQAVLNPNEAREMLGYNPYPGGEVYRTQGANINVLKQDELLDSQIQANKTKATGGTQLKNLNGSVTHN